MQEGAEDAEKEEAREDAEEEVEEQEGEREKEDMQAEYEKDSWHLGTADEVKSDEQFGLQVAAGDGDDDQAAELTSVVTPPVDDEWAWGCEVGLQSNEYNIAESKAWRQSDSENVTICDRLRSLHLEEAGSQTPRSVDEAESLTGGATQARRRADGTVVRTWYPGGARRSAGQAQGKHSKQIEEDSHPTEEEEDEEEEEEEAIRDDRDDDDDNDNNDDFLTARPARILPMGCYIRMGGNVETWLPVEHMVPHTEASTAAIRERVNGTKLRVRMLDTDNATMLSSTQAVEQQNALEARRRCIEDGIAALRDNYNARKWLSGKISAVQSAGAYVSVVEGKDAFMPISELPEKYTSAKDTGDREGASGKSSGVIVGNLQVGQKVDFRVIRYNWQRDSFVASMLSYEESVAKRLGGGGPMTAPAAVPASSRLQVSEKDVAWSPERPHANQSTVPLKRLADKGFSIVTDSAATEVNAWLKQNTLEKMVAAAEGSKAGPKMTEKKFIINVVRGMNVKTLGQVTLPTKSSDQEIKSAAMEMVFKECELKPGQDHKGITIAKNIVHVKC